MHARPPVFHAECYFDCCGVVVFSLFCSFQQMERRFFLKDRFIDRAPAARAQPARVVLFLNGNPFSLSILTLQTLSLGRCVSEDDFMSRGKFDPVCENAWADGTSE